MIQDFREIGVAVWRKLLQNWEKLDDQGADDGVETWVKRCGMFTVYVSSANRIYDFTIHLGDDTEMPVVPLAATNFEDAKIEADGLIRGFVEMGNSILAVDEIRISQITAHGTSLYGVGTDGIVYRRVVNGWQLLPMTRG